MIGQSSSSEEAKRWARVMAFHCCWLVHVVSNIAGCWLRWRCLCVQMKNTRAVWQWCQWHQWCGGCWGWMCDVTMCCCSAVMYAVIAVLLALTCRPTLQQGWPPPSHLGKYASLSAVLHFLIWSWLICLCSWYARGDSRLNVVEEDMESSGLYRVDAPIGNKSGNNIK